GRSSRPVCPEGPDYADCWSSARSWLSTTTSCFGGTGGAAGAGVLVTAATAGRAGATGTATGAAGRGATARGAEVVRVAVGRGAGAGRRGECRKRGRTDQETLQEPADLAHLVPFGGPATVGSASR